MSSCKNEFKHEGYNTICYDIEKDYEAVSKELKASRAFGNSPFNVLRKRPFTLEIRTVDEAKAFLKVIPDGHDGVMSIGGLSKEMEELLNNIAKSSPNRVVSVNFFRQELRMITFGRINLKPELNERVLFLEDTRYTRKSYHELL
jgi:hypothetical protein